MKITGLVFKSIFLVLLLFTGLSGNGYTDEIHYSKTFKTLRHFRVFTPINYDSKAVDKRYNVIYYFHGCGGSYRKSGRYTYQNLGLSQPTAQDRLDDADYDFPNNADFENEAISKDIIIVSVNGKIPGIPACGVYFPYLVEGWEGNWYNFSAYIRELVEDVDKKYNTLVGPQHRAISGLSMGGQMATWVAATNPHLFSSASQFCYSPTYRDVGEPQFQTTIDVHELWRNFRGLPIRHSTNTKDYLKYYATQLYHEFEGAGFENEFYLAEFCIHHAARIDLQFDFHRRNFSNPKVNPACFSFINLYPNFEVWGYQVTSEKEGNGWIYLHDVSKNGMGIYTRHRLPWGKSLEGLGIEVVTPEIYEPGKEYLVSRYEYKTGQISTSTVRANDKGQLTIKSGGGHGEEFGIIGDDLAPPILVLVDTLDENLYLDDDQLKTFSMEVVNLSTQEQQVNFEVSTENEELLTIISQPGEITIPALSKITIDDFFTFKGRFIDEFQNTGFIRISSTINGKAQDRVQYRKVVVKKYVETDPEDFEVKVFDGRVEELPVYQYQWNEWDDPFSSRKITEGRGNGDGKLDPGEIFSIWIKVPSPLEQADSTTWHPAVLLNGRENPDLSVESVSKTRMNTGRSCVSTQMRLLRQPTKERPVKIPVQVEFLQAIPLEDECHRNTADKYGYAYYDLMLFKDGSIGLED